MGPSALILGASGRIGRMLRHYGLHKLSPLWQYRQPVNYVDALIFDPLKVHPAITQFDVVLCLAGLIEGTPSALRINRDLAEAALNIGAECGARRVFLTSSAAVYGAALSPLSEEQPLRPVSDYGRAKAEMEDAALRHAAQLNQPLTILRIGNVAGADALLGVPEEFSLKLDRFADGQGPRRSYIGPQDLAMAIDALLSEGAVGRKLPTILNLALPGAVAMADLLHEVGRRFQWRAAPVTALPEVILGTERLSKIFSVPAASALHIAADWRSYRSAAR